MPSFRTCALLAHAPFRSTMSGLHLECFVIRSHTADQLVRSTFYSGLAVFQWRGRMKRHFIVAKLARSEALVPNTVERHIHAFSASLLPSPIVITAYLGGCETHFRFSSLAPVSIRSHQPLEAQ